MLHLRRIGDGLVHEIVSVCVADGRRRHFRAATAPLEDDYRVEFNEAVADTIARRLRRAAGLSA